ncbi:hypothetical protein ACFVIM_04165 [Streptomyces sp. NPDC057638]|uniref:hypothetical protein n=1 Tax=Streptomyces sp. NPDC057638 TaxID=3346190 RepID=UPI0036988A27
MSFPPLPPATGPRAVPHFAPLRPRRGAHRRLRRAVRRRRRALAAGLALTAAALAASGPRGSESGRPEGRAEARGPDEGGPSSMPSSASAAPGRALAAPVLAPVRIADAETVRLLRPGDRVDVIATPEAAPAPGPAQAPAARVVAQAARVAELPRMRGIADGGGALVVLSVPRPVAAALAGASATSRLAVTVC